MLKAALFPKSCHFIFDVLSFVFHFMLDPPDSNPNPDPNCIMVPARIRQEVSVCFLFHNTADSSLIMMQIRRTGAVPNNVLPCQIRFTFSRINQVYGGVA
jgi:hypothetical protein